MIQMIREVTTSIECDLCGRQCNKYIFDEEDNLFICIDCYEARNEYGK